MLQSLSAPFKEHFTPPEAIISITIECQDQLAIMRFADPWTTEELLEQYSKLITFLDQSPKLVHFLIDVQNTRRVPPGILDIRRRIVWKHIRGGNAAVVGTAGFVKVMLDTIFRLARYTQMSFFSTESEARTYLEQLIATSAPAVAVDNVTENQLENESEDELSGLQN